MSRRNLRRSRLAWQGIGGGREVVPAVQGRVAKASIPPPPDGKSRTAAGPVVEHLPDLLAQEATLGIDTPGLRQTLDFAFAGGDTGDAIDRALSEIQVAGSDWRPDCFAADLFVPELIASCFPVEIKGWRAPINGAFLTRVLTQPPTRVDGAAYRRAILAELADDTGARRTFESVYLSLRHLRRLFEQPRSEARFEATRRRIDTLAAIRDVIDAMATSFTASSSGLSRVHLFGREVKEGEGFARLLELLDYEEHLASVDLRLSVGADGRVRRFELVDIEENKKNRFYGSPLGRALTRLMLWARGYQFTNDELVDRWMDTVFGAVAHVLPVLLQLSVHMEFYLAALAFRDLCAGKGLAVCFPEMVEEGGRDVEALFNPLLFSQGVVPTPCDLKSDAFEAMTIITGPNSGGKTRLLQALGLAQLLAQCGFFVPAKRARLRHASAMFVSLIEEARVDQREGRLGTELIRIRKLFEQSKSGALVILDELCSGTNPSEGEEIFMLVVSLLKEFRPEVFITTHFLQFASRLADDGEALGLTFLQVELDDKQHPTYGFVPGVASTSLAAQTAARLGVTREELMTLIRKNLG